MEAGLTLSMVIVRVLTMAFTAAGTGRIALMVPLGTTASSPGTTHPLVFTATITNQLTVMTTKP
jgi:hypothetical protein